MIIHIIFQILVLIVGLALMAISLLVDAELTANNCQNDATGNENTDFVKIIVNLREKNRFILGLGTALTAFVVTLIVYSFSKANAGVSTLDTPSTFIKFLYLIILVAVGISVLIITANINTDLDSLKQSCKNITSYIKPLQSGGGITLALGILLLIYMIVGAVIGRKIAKKKKTETKAAQDLLLAGAKLMTKANE